LFFDHFEAFGHETVTHDLRFDGPNLLHDVAFLSSLTHDARVLGIPARSADELSFALDRDRWEWFRRDDRLVSISSTLTFCGLLDLEWKPYDESDQDHSNPLPRGGVINGVGIGLDGSGRDSERVTVGVFYEDGLLEVLLAQDQAACCLSDR